MKTTQRLLMLFIVVMAFASCTTLRTVSDFDKNIDFRGYKTYNFYDKGIARLKLNDLDKRRMLSAIESEMHAKGFIRAEKPDLLVNLVVVERERNEMYNYGSRYYGHGWGYPFWGLGMNYYVNQYKEGKIIIDFLDPKQKKIIWHGLGDGFNLDNYNKREERMRAGVKEILAPYPPKVS